MLSRQYCILFVRSWQVFSADMSRIKKKKKAHFDSFFVNMNAGQAILHTVCKVLAGLLG